MKVKTSDLIDAALDWAVAKAKGSKYGQVTFNPKTKRVYETEGLMMVGVNWSPSTDWAQGGPIIEREEICTKRQAPASVGYEWNAWIWTKHIAKGGSNAGGSGPTPLVAAMRCYVASKLGDEIDIPKELT